MSKSIAKRQERRPVIDFEARRISSVSIVVLLQFSEQKKKKERFAA